MSWNYSWRAARIGTVKRRRHWRRAPHRNYTHARTPVVRSTTITTTMSTLYGDGLLLSIIKDSDGHCSLLTTFGEVRADWSPTLWLLLLLLLLSTIMVQARQQRYQLNEARRERNPRLHPTYDAPMIDATTRQQYHYFVLNRSCRTNNIIIIIIIITIR